MSIWTSLEPASTTVDPGSTATVRLRLRNTGDVVDEYRFVPVGDIAPYVTVEPPVLRLFPGTTGTVALTFAPPRTPDAKAGPNPYGVQIIPTEHPEATTVPEGNLTITPFSEIRAELVPHTVKGRFSGRPKLAIDNLGNTRLSAFVNGSESGDQLSYEIHPANVQIEPGRATFVKATVRPRQIAWFGRKQNRPYQLAVQRSGVAPHQVEGTYVQMGFLPRWLATFLSVLLALTVMSVIAWFAYKPQVQSLAMAKTDEAAASALPNPPALSPLPSAPAASPSAPAAEAGGGGGDPKPKSKPKQAPDPADQKNVLIRNTETDKCVDVPGGEQTNPGDAVDQFTCDGTNQDNQLWDLEVRYPKGGPSDNSLFQIRNVKSDLCMDLPGGGPEPGHTALNEFACTGTKADNQLWWLDKQSDGGYWIRNYASGHLCLNVDGFLNDADGKARANSTILTILDCVNNDDREWKFEKQTS
ncbi:hydrogenase expression protein [Streptomyces sp. 150FB]|uniref:RICIN domain-containing protein n=1 Tax=Streptomyces sp. 150FB TaxID=1576605 RepID=UPI0005893BC4|nr:RICIN domain-containing protein [Streptomyces sp. 150FB]KIF75904.1 hydrogenase expression protein [Streptomyces sp. 150FB]